MTIYSWHVEATGEELRRAAVPKYLKASMRKEWTAETVKPFGIYPIVETPKPETTSLQKLEPGERVRIGDEYHRVWNIVNRFETQEELDAFLAEAKETKKTEINRVRYSKIYMDSIPYTFPGDTEPDGIQMRDETDRQNIQDFVIDAANKDPESIMYWMPVSNNVKTVTAAQAVQMGQYLKARGDQIMAYSWQLKAQVNEATTAEAVENINITEGWPA